jgi:hypothetical protein
MFSKVWKVFKEVAIGILLVLSLWLVIGGAYKKEIGNLSDWISAACNILMASAAIYAATEARKWFQQKNKLNSIDAAHQKIQRYEDTIWGIHKEIYSDATLRMNLEYDINNDRLSKDEIKTIINNQIERTTTTDIQVLAEVYSEMARLKRHGITINTEYGEIIEDILSKRTNYLNLHRKYLINLFKKAYDSSIDVEDVSLELTELQIEFARLFENKLSAIQIDQHYDLSNLK